MKVTDKSNTRSISDFSSTRRKLSQRTMTTACNIFTNDKFRMKKDYAILSEYDLDIPKISFVEPHIKRSNQPFRRCITNSVYLRTLQPYGLSKISSMRNTNND